MDFFLKVRKVIRQSDVYVYELWRVSARTSPNKNWLWKIRGIFQVSPDLAIAYMLCCR